jgi:hypothetical protein
MIGLLAAFLLFICIAVIALHLARQSSSTSVFKRNDIATVRVMLQTIKDEAARHKAHLDNHPDVQLSFIRIYNSAINAEKYLEEM